MQVWGHFAGGERDEYMGDDPHSVGAPFKGAAGQDHPDHRLLAGQSAVAVLNLQWHGPRNVGLQSFGLSDHPKLAVWEKLRIVL